MLLTGHLAGRTRLGPAAPPSLTWPVAGALAWIKSSLSAYNGNCVEVAGLNDDTIGVRDSKHPRGAVINFTPAEWDAFIGGVRNGEFDRKPLG
jgi:hypothetical protein